MADFEIQHDRPGCIGCLTPETLIVGPYGAKPIKDIVVGDLVLTSKGKFEPVTGTTAHYHDGKIFDVQVRSMGTISITEEHPVLSVRRKTKEAHNVEPFNFEWVEASKLKHLDYVTFPKPIGNAANNFLRFEHTSRQGRKEVKADFTPDFFRLAGYYIAEGNTLGKTKTTYCRQITLTFRDTETELATDAAQLFERVFGLKSYIYVRAKKHTRSVLVNSSILAKAFEEWFGHGAQNKRAPAEMLTAEPALQSELIRGLWRGDGWIGKDRATYTTISRTLAEQVKLLLLRQDILSSMDEHEAKHGHRASYVPKVCNPYLAKLETIVSGNASKSVAVRRLGAIQTESRLLLPILKITERHYTGAVYNLEVKSTEDYCTNAGIVHNCNACASIAPEYWTMNPEDGKSDVVGSTKRADEWEVLVIPADKYDLNKLAADSCPVNVIHLVNKETGEKVI